jgi:hypothetical protein
MHFKGKFSKITGFLFCCIILLVNSVNVTAQRRFIDSLAEINSFLEKFHFVFENKYVYYPEDRYHILVFNYKSPEARVLPLKNAAKPLRIQTSDGSGQCVHPSVIDFYNEFQMKEWNGYRYWMAMTPYPFSNSRKENPDIVASSDGINWVVPKGIINPVDQISGDTNTENLADPDIIYNPDSDQIWLYYMHRAGNKKQTTINLIRINRDLSHEEPVEVIRFPLNDSLTFVSPCIWRESVKKFHMWAVRLNLPNYIVYLSSVDGLNWSAQQLCLNNRKESAIHQINWRPWHICCKPNYRENRVELMACCSRGAGETTPAYQSNGLFYLEASMKNPSLLKLTIYVPILFACQQLECWDYPVIYRSAFEIYKDTGRYFYKVWYSSKSNKTGEWHIGFTEGAIGTEYTNLKICAQVSDRDTLFINSGFRSVNINYYGPSEDTVQFYLYGSRKRLLYSGKIKSPYQIFNIYLLPRGEYFAEFVLRNYVVRKYVRKL